MTTSPQQVAAAAVVVADVVVTKSYWKRISIMFEKVSYRRGLVEGVVLYLLGRLASLITPAFFPDWTYVAAPLFFLVLQYCIAPVWATRRIASTKRERLSKRFFLLGPRMALICFALDVIITLTCGMAIVGLGGVQRGPVLLRFFAPEHLPLLDFAIYEVRTFTLLMALFTLSVICTRLARGGFLRFTMPAGGDRVTL